jgi:hypothetical protein
MSHRELAANQHGADSRRKLKKAQCIRDSRSIFGDGLCDLLLCKSEFIDEALITFGLFDRIEVRPLEVLNERYRQERLVLDRTHKCRNRFPAQFCGGSESALTSDKFVSLSARSDEDWLKKTVGRQARGEIRQLTFLEVASRLCRVRSN